MSSWRDHILNELTPQVSRLTVVADPDGLLTEEGIILALREKGFELLEFDDPVAFRFSYELKYRSLWDKGEITDLVVILRSAAADLKSLPYDLLEAGRKLSFNLGELFPNLSYPVIEALNRSDLEALHQAQIRFAPEMLGDNATKDFILRHVFEIAPELIKKPSDLLRVLLRRHYSSQNIPQILDERFISILHQHNCFDSWPLENIVSDRETFFEFLQERWPIFLTRMAAEKDSAVCEQEEGCSYNLKYAGPSDIPFDHDDIRIYIDNLFLDGALRPVQHPFADLLSSKWVLSGLQTSPEADVNRRLEKLLTVTENSMPGSQDRHTDWLTFAHRWAELLVVLHEAKGIDSLRNRFAALQAKLDSVFLEWILRRFTGLHNQPPSPPVMLHHIPRAIAREMGEAKDRKTALIVVDSMSYDHWLLIKEELQRQALGFSIREKAVFGWVPTITTVSRQAIFSGKPPLYFANSIHTTEREPFLWSQFWIAQGFTQSEVAYARGIDEVGIRTVDELTSDSRIRVIGLVVDKVDRITHGMELGAAGMHNQIRQWAEQGFLGRLITLLLDRHFEVHIASDHGSIEAKGCGRPGEGALADVGGERARIYSDAALRKKVKNSFPQSVEWPAIGLPPDYLPLLAYGREAFVLSGKQTVTHGGISLEELVVPYIKIERIKN